jgi:hypothetical protein
MQLSKYLPTLILALCSLFAIIAAQQNFYIRPKLATGTYGKGDGSDWSNAFRCESFPLILAVGSAFAFFSSNVSLG